MKLLVFNQLLWSYYPKLRVLEGNRKKKEKKKENRQLMQKFWCLSVEVYVRESFLLLWIFLYIYSIVYNGGNVIFQVLLRPSTLKCDCLNTFQVWDILCDERRIKFKFNPSKCRWVKFIPLLVLLFLLSGCLRLKNSQLRKPQGKS